jgi:hypothetical protein
MKKIKSLLLLFVCYGSLVHVLTEVSFASVLSLVSSMILAAITFFLSEPKSSAQE